MAQVTFYMNRDRYNHCTDKYIHVIKGIRGVTGFGLKESKECVDALRDKGIVVVECAIENTSDVKEALRTLADYGVTIGKDCRTQKHITSLREMACALILEGNENLARDLMVVTEKWSKIVDLY
jgi:hypothetical protein